MTPDAKAMTVALASIDRERVLASRTVFLTRAWVMRDGGAMTVWRIVGSVHDERQVEDLVVGNLQRQVWSQGDEDNRGGEHDRRNADGSERAEGGNGHGGRDEPEGLDVDARAGPGG